MGRRQRRFQNNFSRSSFTVELTVPNDLACLSNMTVAERSENGNIITYKFDKTPIMSTYLLAWFIGEFEYVESKTSRDIVVRVWTEVGKKDTGKFALDVACKCLDFYEKYFDIKYPLPKCDMVACPDFAAGAMENWGLITYREIALLANLIDVDVSKIGHYLPLTLMSSHLVDYLNNALIAGNLTQAQVLLNGPLASFPFTDHEGIFVVDYPIKGIFYGYWGDN